MTTPAEKLLEYLEFFGIGNYVDVTGIILGNMKRMPIEEFSDYKTRVHKFLDDLERNGFTKYHNTVFTKEQIKITAAIQPKGLEFINNRNRQNTPTINIQNNPVFSQSFSSSSNDNASPIIQVTNNAINSTSSTKSYTEKLYWVAGIILGLIGIWQVYEKCHQSSDKNKIQKDFGYDKKIDSALIKNDSIKSEKAASVNYKKSSPFILNTPKKASLSTITKKTTDVSDPIKDLNPRSYEEPHTSLNDILTDMRKNQRHVSVEDLNIIYTEIANSNDEVYITYYKLDFESESFAKEIYDSLKYNHKHLNPTGNTFFLSLNLSDSTMHDRIIVNRMSLTYSKYIQVEVVRQKIQFSASLNSHLLSN